MSVHPEPGRIDLSCLNPDFDKDGKVGPWEKKIYDSLMAANVDGTGLTAPQFFGVLKSNVALLRGEAEKTKLFKKLFIATAAMVILLVGATVGLTYVVVAGVKDEYTDGNSHLIKNKKGAVVGSGVLATYATPLSSRMRRLKVIEVNGERRRLVTLADVDEASCAQVKADAEASGEMCGTSTVQGDSTKHHYQGCVTSESGDNFDLRSTQNDRITISNCNSAAATVNRLRQLSLEEAAEPTRRRHLAARIDHQFKPVHEGCVVYHCFEGEHDCDEPSPSSACIEWDDKTMTCKEPLCKYVAEEGDVH